MTEDEVRAAAERLVQFHDRFAPLFGKQQAQFVRELRHNRRQLKERRGVRWGAGQRFLKISITEDFAKHPYFRCH